VICVELGEDTSRRNKVVRMRERREDKREARRRERGAKTRERREDEREERERPEDEREGNFFEVDFEGDFFEGRRRAIF